MVKQRKIKKRRGSKMLKHQTQTNENQQKNEMMSSEVPIYQKQFYPVQPQMMPNGVPIIPK